MPTIWKQKTLNTDALLKIYRKSEKVFFYYSFRLSLRAGLLIYLAMLNYFCLLHRKKSIRKHKKHTVLMTGTFYSDNWIRTHLRPLALSKNCTKVIMVSSVNVPPMEKVESITPPLWLSRIIGTVPSRLIFFIIVAIKIKPDTIGGFHLLFNGLLAGLLAPLLGARSLYICGGGPREVAGGGFLTENRLFRLLGTPDPIIEELLLKAVQRIDHIITMGTGAASFFRDKGICSIFFVHPGGFDGDYYSPAPEINKKSDLVLVGRLSSVKRVDIFLNTVKRLKKKSPDVSAVIVGDGPERKNLERLARELCIEGNVSFVGHQSSVKEWLDASRVFVLTSDSEGVSQAMIEAMLSGLPAVVSDVGDLKDLVDHGKNGFLVSKRTSDQFADAIAKLLNSKDTLTQFKVEARKQALRHDIPNATQKWDKILK